ncbi:MAG: N-acetyltransferase [Planctomycetes bacterium]|nr:N-acetyltransferase [Planctomycetota bacterium]
MIHRLAIAADFDAIAAITNHYIRTTAIHFGYEDVTADELRTLFVAGEQRYPWLVAELDGEIAGYAKAGAWRTRAAYDWIAESGIYFAPAHCGRGHGAPLYRRLLDLLRAQGFHAVIGGATMPNPASARLHEQLGFEPCGIVHEVGWKHDRWHDVAFWQLRLAASGHPAQPIRTPEAVWDELFGGPEARPGSSRP